MLFQCFPKKFSFRLYNLMSICRRSVVVNSGVWHCLHWYHHGLFVYGPVVVVSHVIYSLRHTEEHHSRAVCVSDAFSKVVLCNMEESEEKSFSLKTKGCHWLKKLSGKFSDVSVMFCSLRQLVGMTPRLDCLVPRDVFYPIGPSWN